MSADSTGGAVEVFYQDYCFLREQLSENPSGLAALNSSYHKHLLIAAASSLECSVKRLVPEMFRGKASEALVTFVDKRVMARSYHTLFDWKRGKATSFFSSFGERCGEAFKKALNEDDSFKSQHDSFMRLGQLRNEVIHGDYASIPIYLTPEDIIKDYRQAVCFVDKIRYFVCPDELAAGSSEP